MLIPSDYTPDADVDFPVEVEDLEFLEEKSPDGDVDAATGDDYAEEEMPAYLPMTFETAEETEHAPGACGRGVRLR